MLYSPRSRSTWTHNVLTAKFGLDPTWCEPLLESRRPRQDYAEYPEIIDRINRAENCCIKISCNDFVDIKNKQIRKDYQDINWNHFDHVITHTREDFVGAVLSYAYMDMRDKNTWHRRRGEIKVGHEYQVDPNIMYYLLRGYAMFDVVRQHIDATVDPAKIHHYEFNTAADLVSQDFGLTAQDLEANIVDNELDYRRLATNYNDIAQEAPTVLMRLKNQIHAPGPEFWKNSNTIL